MTRPALFLLLAMALPAGAAETLNSKAMDRAYIPETTPCLRDKTRTRDRDCGQTPTSSLTDKALRDAEQQNTQQQLNNPQLNNPDVQVPPPQLPPPELSPRQQQIIDEIRHLPGQF